MISLRPGAADKKYQHIESTGLSCPKKPQSSVCVTDEATAPPC